MSTSLPPEILDSIIDHLYNDSTALKGCCVVSKSWIHRTRSHLFARVEFRAPKSHFELWKKTFPDPPISPAHHTRHLSIYGLSHVTTADAEACSWIRAFHNVEHLHLEALGWNDRSSLTLFHGLSPTLTSLYLANTYLEALGLVCSFPLLEDLAVSFLDQGDDAWNTPSTSPKLTGSLSLRAVGDVYPVARRLLDLPNGLHFTKIAVACIRQDVKSTTDLVSRCSDTLESLSICYYVPEISGMPTLDLSKATNLKDVEFRCGRPTVQWITMALQTARSENLQQITGTIYLVGISANSIEDTVRREWQDLDRVLVQFWTSRSIRPKLTCEAGNSFRGLAPSLLPGLMRRGFVELVEHKR